MAAGKGKKKDEENVAVTQLNEVWLETTDGYLADNWEGAGVNKVKELYRHDHTGEKYHMPVRMIRDVPVGSFWGRSYEIGRAHV